MAKKLKGKRLAQARKNLKKARAAIRRKAQRVPTKKRGKSSKKKRKSQPIRRSRPKRKTSMAKKRRSTKSRFGIPSIAKKAAAGIGLATIATVLVGQFAPQAAPIVRPIAAFAGGGITGVVADLLLSGGGLLSGLFGGGGQGQMVDSV